ncbi:beta-galactosidase [Nostocoides vanveenii]|uniref:Beta-galactosidase n=1 Tax=Nostocoides vanveenii TaxID=330835 RepID=A0ABN2KAX5_9MICO
MRAWPTGRLAYGGDYNPEQWPRAIWRADVDLMHRASVSFVTLGVFSWSWLEPHKGEYEFGWLDDVMDLMAEADIAVDLATATASPPPWLTTAYPDILPRTADGVIMWPGSRQSWCPSSPIFADASRALVTQLAQRYHSHPALAMWHISNEYACHNLPCYCDTCAAAFRTWLQNRYGTTDALNHAWGTAFWSQRYTDFEQVLPPRRTPTFHNPTQVLDYHRFGSDTLLGLYRGERTILADLSPGVPVTTNFMTMTGFRLLDYNQWAPEQDVVSTDHYRVAALPNATAELSFQGAVTRGLAGGAPWLLMEHSTSAVNWQPVNPAKPLGGTIHDSLTHVANGADTIGYFQWRASRAGAEKWHSALVPHAGADSARFAEVCRLGAAAAALGEVAGSRVEAAVAILYDFQALWAASGPAMPSAAADYPEMAQAVHKSLRDMGITADVVHPSADLSRYRVIVVPTLYLVTDEHAAAIAAAAEAGAQVLVTYFSGISDEHDHIRLGGYPGAFRELLGVRVEEFNPLLDGDEVGLLAAGPGRSNEAGAAATGADTAGADVGTGRRWSEWCAVTDAAPLWTYAGGPCAGSVALARRHTGSGAAWYLGTLPDEAALANVLASITEAAGVGPVVAELPVGVEAIRRRAADGRSWVFLLNHTDDPITVPLSGFDVLTGAVTDGHAALTAGGVAVLREE